MKEETNMEKPVTMEIAELRTKLTDAVNESMLHPEIIEMVVDNLHAQIARIAQEQRQREKMQYKKALEEESEKKAGEDDGTV